MCLKALLHHGRENDRGWTGQEEFLFHFAHMVLNRKWRELRLELRLSVILKAFLQ